MGSRRVEECLWALSFSLTSLAAIAAVRGAPILGIDLNTCQSVIPQRMTEAERVKCCLVDNVKPIVDFKFDPDSPKRVRRPVHKLNKEEIAKYERAYEIMRSLPDDDPRSLVAQNRAHCAYCAETYRQFNSTEPLLIHENWLIWPWHRWYLYFHERILASLIGDETFALPYWAWDVQNETSPKANTIPDIYLDEGSSLYHSVRSHFHVSPLSVDLTHQDVPENKDPEELRISNYYSMWRSMIADVSTPLLFHGSKYRLGDKPGNRLKGNFEAGPHIAVHQWVGDETLPNWRDLGTLEFSGLDPIFYTHHAQLDRLWTMWKKSGGQDFQDPDWLNAEFLLYDEHGDLVRVNIKDSLDNEKLNLYYEHIAPDWMDHLPQSIRETNAKYARRPRFVDNLRSSVHQMLYGEQSLLAMLGKVIAGKSLEKKVLLGGSKRVVTEYLGRPTLKARRSLKKASSPSAVTDEALLIEGMVTKPFEIPVTLNVFIDLPEVDRSTSLSCVESLGTVLIKSQTPSDKSSPAPGKIVTHKFSQKIGIGPRYDILNITDSRSVAVSLVAAWNEAYNDQVQVEISELTIQLQAF